MSDMILMLLSFPRHNTWSGEVPAAMLAAWEANSGHRFTSELLADFAASPVKKRGVETMPVHDTRTGRPGSLHRRCSMPDRHRGGSPRRRVQPALRRGRIEM